jgi:hypothetical protein
LYPFKPDTVSLLELVGSIEGGQDIVTLEQVIEVVLSVETGEGGVLSGEFAKAQKQVVVHRNAIKGVRGHQQNNFIAWPGSDQ